MKAGPHGVREKRNEPAIPGGSMNGIGKRILWVVFLCLLAACSRKAALVPPAEEALPPPAKEALPPPPPPGLQLSVVQCRLAANGEFVGVRFRVTGVDRFDPDAAETYLVDESTGEKFFVVRLQRIGRLAEFSAPGEKDVHHVMFRNREGKLKLGTRVTVVVGPARQEHLLLQE